MKRPLTCPHCGAELDPATPNPWRPFCSERCQLIDLGDWASGTYSIPVQEQDGFLPLDSDIDEQL